MEGLIPYLVHAIKKQRPHHRSFRCMSDTSNRSYHVLIGADSVVDDDGSSHRRTFSDQRYSSGAGLEYFPNVRSSAFNNNSAIGSMVSSASALKPNGGPTAAGHNNLMKTSGYQASYSMAASTFNHRR